MTEKQVESIVDELTQEQTRLRERLAELKTELSKIEAALCRVTGALNALRGNSKTRTRKPAVTKQEVVNLIHVVLRKKSPLQRDVLKKVIEQQIIANGKSRMGFALRFKEALAVANVRESNQELSLSSQSSTDLS